MKTPSIVVADDHPMLLKGLVKELEFNNYNVVASFTNGMELYKYLLSNNVDIVLTDIDMPGLNGFEIIKLIRLKRLNTKFIVQSFHKESAIINEAISLSVDGYILKEDDFLEITNCINNVLNGFIYYSKSLSEFKKEGSRLFEKLKRLTPSELRILKLISQNKTNSEIANQYFVSVRTVEKHRENLRNKLFTSKSQKLVNWAIENRIIIDNM
ncbi:response regulator transcription factor [Flavobacteriaceae bacterium]|nr:response regulator transcription factor [Flavobacteriaceae bacterium]